MNSIVRTTIGISTGLLSTIMFTVGSVLQKKSIEALSEFKLKRLLQEKMWIGGFVLGMLGGAPYMLSQYFIGISYTQMLMAFGLIVLVAISRWFLKEPVGMLEYLGILAIIGGIILLGFSQISPVTVTFSAPNFVRNLVLFYTPFYMLSLLILGVNKWVNDKVLALSAGIWYGCGAGLSQTGLLAISTGRWVPAVIVYFMFICGALLGTLAVNLAYQKGKAIVIIPILSLGNYILPVISGLLIFGQTFSPAHNLWYFFVPSSVITLGGVMLLSRTESRIGQQRLIADEELVSPTIFLEE